MKAAMRWAPSALLTLLGLLVLAGCKPGARQAAKPVVLKADHASIKATPLLPPTAAAEQFTRLSPDETGIAFANNIDSEDLIVQAYTQSGVASADYDGDGDLDLYVLGITQPNVLYRNDGGWKFTDVTAEAGAGLDGGSDQGSSAFFADLTCDGQLDLYVVNRNGANQLFSGDGGGHFSLVEGGNGLGSAAASISAAIFDAENDGDLDVYIANYRRDQDSTELMEAAYNQRLKGVIPAYGNWNKRSDVGTVEVAEDALPSELRDDFYVDPSGLARLRPEDDQFLLNDGQGNFSDATEQAGLRTISWTYQAQACDFNDDGFIDLYVSSDYETPDHCFMNDGDGTFTDRAVEMWRKSPLYSMGVDTGDVNGDGRMDLFVADMLSPDYKRAKIQSGDMYQWRWELTNTRPQPQMRNMLFVNRGGGWMSECAQFSGVAASEWTWAVRIQDLNCDGQPELFATNGMLRDSMDWDLITSLANLKSTATDPREVRRFFLEQPSYFTDDIIFTPKGPLSYDKAPDNWGMQDGTMGCGASLADYDGDGDVDIIANYINAPLGVWRNDFSSGNRVRIALRGSGRNPQAAGARVWAQCGEDIFAQDVILSRGFETGESGWIFLGLGEHTKIDSLKVRWPDGRLQLYADLAAGMHYDISQEKRLPKWEAETPAAVFSQASLPFRQVEQNTYLADYAAEPLLPMQQSLNGTGVAVADYDGDGAADLYLCAASGQSGALLKGDGQGGFTPDPALDGLVPAECEQMAGLWFDANADGRPDLLVACGGQESPAGSESYGPRLLLNLPAGFRPASLPGGGMSLAASAAGDIDGDGDLDLVLGGHLLPHRFGATAPSLVLANDGQGNFSDALAALAPGFGQGGQITDLQFGDFNNDGRPDLAVAKNWAPLEIWLNQGRQLAKSPSAGQSGWWQSLGLGDFDNDGDLDIAAGNTGANTKYHPKAGAPVAVYASDFDGNGTRDLVEVKFRKDGQMLPGRGRSCSGYAIGYIAQKWPTWRSFADATLEDVYGAGLKSAEQLTADQLDSQILLNNGAGAFTASSLPLEAQLAPVYGIGVQDFDADGNLDLLLANNSVAPQCEAGSWNQGYGLLLRGDGAGGFAALAPAESGVLVPGCARGVVPADFNGDRAADAVVSMSDGEAQLLLGGPPAGGGLAVTLRGKAPNTAAVGARLRLTLSDGRVLLREVQAGQGYLSSCAGPVLFPVPAGVSAAGLSVQWPDGTAAESAELASGLVELTQ